MQNHHMFTFLPSRKQFLFCYISSRCFIEFNKVLIFPAVQRIPLNSRQNSRIIEFIFDKIFLTVLSLENKVRMCETYNNNFTNYIVRETTTCER